MRAHIDGDDLVFEDPVSHRTWRLADHGDDLMFNCDDIRADGEDRHPLWIRASDAASVGDWLRRKFADRDWRLYAAGPTSIPLEVKP